MKLAALLLSALGVLDAPAEARPPAIAWDRYRPLPDRSGRTRAALEAIRSGGAAERKQAAQDLLGEWLPDLPLLRAAARGEDPELMETATAILDHHLIRAEREASPLLRALAEAPPPDALDILQNLAAVLPEGEWIAWRRSLVSAARTQDLDRLRAWLRTDVAPVRCAALQAIDRLSPDTALLLARELVLDRSLDMRLACLPVLARTADPRLAEALPVMLAESAGRPEFNRVALWSRRLYGRNPLPLPAGIHTAGQWAAWLAETGRPARPWRPEVEGGGFDALNLSNWQCLIMGQAAAPDPFWSARDGILRFKGGTEGVLRARDEWESYTLELEWRWPEGNPGDGGVWVLLSDALERNPDGLEVQLLAGNEGDFWGLGALRGAGRPVSHQRRRQAPPKRDPGDWRSLRVDVSPARVVVEIDDVPVNEMRPPATGGRRLGLQMENAPLEFRNIRILPDNP